jgi:hypothetical protein
MKSGKEQVTNMDLEIFPLSAAGEEATVEGDRGSAT